MAHRDTLLVSATRIMPPALGARFFDTVNRVMRRAKRYRLVTTRFGFKIECDLTDLIQNTLFHFGHWEPNVSKVIHDSLEPGDVFIDVGANIGYDSLLAATRVGPAGRVVAIEAAPDTFEKLRRNIELNGASTARLHNLAASDGPGKLVIREVSAGNIGTASTAVTTGRVIAEVDAVAIESLLSADELARVRLIKMDIEGGEIPVLRHILDTLDLYPPSLMVLVELSALDSPDAKLLFDRFVASGFTAWIVENEYTLEWYLRWSGSPPLRQVAELPTRQTDILFRRGG